MKFVQLLRRKWSTFAAPLVAVIVALLKDIILKILKRYVGDTIGGLVYTLLMIVTVGLVIYLIGRAMRPKPQEMVTHQERPPQMKALILLLGPGRQGEAPESQSAEAAIEYHRRKRAGDQNPVLHWCWLICSAKSQAYANELAEKYREKGMIVTVMPPVDGFDPQATYDTVAAIYSTGLVEQKLANQDVIADFTGATKLMSLGMAFYCTLNNHQMQYMTGGQPALASVPKMIEFRPQSP